MTSISKDYKIKGSCNANLKNSPELAGVQTVEMRGQKWAGSPGADRKTHGNDEKAFTDKCTACIVKRLTMRYENGGFKKGELCKSVRPRQIDAMTEDGRACLNHMVGPVTLSKQIRPRNHL